jgi:hypothetical protein
MVSGDSGEHLIGTGGPAGAPGDPAAPARDLAGDPAGAAGRAAGAAASLIRHRWLTAAGMTATVAVIAGGGLALARHEPTAGQHRDCGLVLCSATLPGSVTASTTQQAGASASPRPAPVAATSPDRPGGHTRSAPAGRSRVVGRGIGAGYETGHQRGHPASGHLVITNHGPAPVPGWPGRWWHGPHQHDGGGWPGGPGQGGPGPGGGGGWPGGPGGR